MRLTLRILIIISILLFAKIAFCADRTEALSQFYKGNTSYSLGDFVDAIKEYEVALSSGYESAELYYNLGNAYFKSGSLGKAVLNYLRAKELAPNDADLNSNLNFARSMIKDRVVPPQNNFLARVFSNFVAVFNLDQLTIISFILYLLFCGLVICFILLRNLRRIFGYASLVVLVFLIVFVLGFISKYDLAQVLKRAVVIAESAECKFEPFKEATTFFDLSEGEEVSIVSEKNSWVKVKRCDGKQGWLERSQIEAL